MTPTPLCYELLARLCEVTGAIRERSIDIGISNDLSTDFKPFFE
jgi:hypothetical protein